MGVAIDMEQATIFSEIPTRLHPIFPLLDTYDTQVDNDVANLHRP